MSACPTVCIGVRKVGGITLSGKNHVTVTCPVRDDSCIRVCGCVVQELVDQFLGVASGTCLLSVVVWQRIRVPVTWCCQHSECGREKCR